MTTASFDRASEIALLYRIDVSVGSSPHESTWRTMPAVYVPHAAVNEMLVKIHQHEDYKSWQSITVVVGKTAVYGIDRVQLAKDEVPQWV